MKKKEYITPNMRMLSCGMGSLLSGSGVSADGIGYGGVDKDGSMDPSAKYDDISFNENILSDDEE